MAERRVTEVQAAALGEAYAWSCILNILSGDTAPRTEQGQAVAEEVAKLAAAERDRLMKSFLAKEPTMIAAAPPPEVR
ncbi:hypothetical protein NG829_08280 [Xanthomonas sacchari]|uniref:hypothetical protein n=1 Tax=Xanthomonas sacchari TaxID=56458 RepID=UPI00225DD711|nr:hypothetical protein [Xanthomonas sacchari]UYK82272.1 hypothetical protein NG829_08280 [Xanthomonas sacchari]